MINMSNNTMIDKNNIEGTNNKLTDIFLKGRQGRLNLFLTVVWGSYSLNYLNFIFSRIPGLSEYTEYTSSLLVVVAMLFALNNFVKKEFMNVLLFYLCGSIIILFSYLNAPISNVKWIEEYVPAFFFSVLPFVFVGRAFKDERIFDVLYYVSLVSIILFYIYNFIIHPISNILLEDNKISAQGLSYVLLPFALLVEWKLIDKFNVISLLFFVWAFIMLMLLGSRGSFFSPMLFALLYLIFINKIFVKHKWLIILILIVSCFWVVYYEEVLLYFYDFAESLGFNARIIELMMEDEVLSDNGRNPIFISVFKALSVNPSGLGLCGVQALTNQFYAHNLFLELVASYGWIIGGFFSISFIILVVKGYLGCINDTQKAFFLMLFCTAPFPLMFSGIFLNQPFLFIFIGYCFYLIEQRKMKLKVR